jgi:hypothetical protein
MLLNGWSAFRASAQQFPRNVTVSAQIRINPPRDAAQLRRLRALRKAFQEAVEVLQDNEPTRIAPRTRRARP